MTKPGGKKTVLGGIHLIMAWRNLWRNPMRSGIILTAVTIGVWFMIFYGMMGRGMIDQMREHGIGQMIGHIQIHAQNYLSDPVIDYRIADPKTLIAQISPDLPDGTRIASRIKVDGVAQNARHNTGVSIYGIEPEDEIDISFIGWPQSIPEGEYLDGDDDIGIMIGLGLAHDFETRIGKKIILMSKGADNEIVSRAFRIRGLFTAELKSTEKSIVFVTREAAQEMLGLDTAITEMSLTLPAIKYTDMVHADLQKNLAGSPFAVSRWIDRLPIVRAYLEIMDGFMFIWYLIVFIAMGFGVVNTTLMAVLERIREYGLLKSLGLLPRWILLSVLIESLIILTLGAVLGDILALATYAAMYDGINLSAWSEGTEYFGMPHILKFALNWRDFLFADMIVIVLGVLVCLYPASKAARITPVEALAHV
ncbi:MAG: FtsX-like permease family protein [Pseudomonadota bacterium]|nr:FtsX-like permease family protein [Pseudomonadota bacterium]